MVSKARYWLNLKRGSNFEEIQQGCGGFLNVILIHLSVQQKYSICKNSLCHLLMACIFLCVCYTLAFLNVLS